MHSRAFGDSEAIVKDRKVDWDGFPLVLIEWDKEFWNFTGQPDGWAFENHFDIVERHEENDMPDNKVDVDKLIESLSAVISEFKGEASSKEDPPPQSDPIEEDAEKYEYEGRLTAAKDIATDAQAFLLISIAEVESERHPGEMILVPSVVSSYRNDKIGKILEAQLSEMASVFHHQHVMELINDVGDDDS